MSRERLRSWDEIRDKMPQIVARLNSNVALAVAAAANPFLALSELGYEVAPEAQADIEDRLRFSPDAAKQLGELRRRIYAAAGHPFAIESREELARVLFHELGITPYPDERGCIPPLPDASPLPRFHVGQPSPKDPLEPLSRKHPILEPLLAYRRLDASAPRFASDDAYAALRKGEIAHPVRGLTVRFREKPEPSGGGKPPSNPADPEEQPAGSKLNLNRASAAEIELLPDISLKRPSGHLPALRSRSASSLTATSTARSPRSLSSCPSLA